MDPYIIIPVVVNGLMTGGIYALIAISLNLIFGVMKIINFAQGNFMVLGMYFTFWLYYWFHMDPYISILFTFPTLFVIGIIIQRFLIRPILKAPEENQILLTIGLLIFLENLALFIWGPNFRSVKVSYSGTAIVLGNLVINLPRLLAFVFSIIMVVGLFQFLRRTDMGKSIRAAVDDSEGALLAGINVRKIQLISFGIGIGAAGVAGSMIIPFHYVAPHIGTEWTITAFIIVILGGLGQFFGALIGGLIIGVVESLGAIFMPGSLKEVPVFIIFILILLMKPQGIFGSTAR